MAEWAQHTDLALTAAEQSYLQASAAEQAREEAAEADRQARERALEQRSRQRLRVTVGVLAVAAIVSLALSLFAWRQRNDALHAYSLSLTANALEALKDGDSATALALALVATNIDDPPLLARQTLLNAAYAPGPRRRYDVTTLFPGVQGPATALALSPDGQTAYIGCADGLIVAWDWADERETGRFAAHSAPVNAILVAPDGQRLFSAGADGLIGQWDLGAGRIGQTLSGHSGSVRSLDLSQDGQRLISGGFSGDDYDAPGELFLWDVTTGEIVHRFDGHVKGVVQAQFVLEDTAILASSGDLELLVDQGGSDVGGVLSDLILWDIDSGDSLSILDALGYDATVITPLPGGFWVLIGSFYDNIVVLFDLSSSQVVQRFSGHSDAIKALATGVNGAQALSGSADQSLFVWNLNTGQLLHRLQGHDSPVTGVVVTPDFRVALSISSSGELIRWDLHDAMDVRRFIGHGDMVYDVALLPDGAHFVSASGSPSPAVPAQDTSLRLWEIGSGRQLMAQTIPAPVIFQVAAAPDGQVILANNTLYEAATLAPLGQLSGHAEGAWVTAVAISPDGHQALTSSTDSTLILWDLPNRQPLCRIEPGIAGGLWSAVFSPDGQMTLTESVNGVMGLWDLGACAHMRDYGMDLAAGPDVSDAMFHPDGQSVFGATADGYVYQFELENGRLLRTFGPHNDIRVRLAVTPDGALLLTSGMDGSLRLWDVPSGELIRQFGTPGTVIFDVTLGPDGRTVFAGSSDHTIVQWQVGNPSLAELKAWIEANRVVRALTCAERALYDVEPFCE